MWNRSGRPRDHESSGSNSFETRWRDSTAFVDHPPRLPLPVEFTSPPPRRPIHQEPDELDLVRAEREEMQRMRREIEMEKAKIIRGQEETRKRLSAPPPPVIHESVPSPIQPVIKPGNYLIATVDLTTWKDREGVSGSMIQLGTYLPHGVSHSFCMLPENVDQSDLISCGVFFKVREAMFMKVGSKLVPTFPRDHSLVSFLDFLEKGCRRVRPAFDGVILLSYLQEDLPHVIKAFMKAGLYDRFANVVKGVADLCNFVAKEHSWRFMVNGKLELSLAHVYYNTVGERFNHANRGPDGRAEGIYQCLERLLENKPSFGNFIGKFAHHLKSREILKLVNFKTEAERLELFLPLQLFIADELADEQVELIVASVYAPSEQDEEKYLSEPQKVAIGMCQILVQAGFDFEGLLKSYQQEGLAQLELKLRTTFLERMMNKSRAVIDQTIRTQKLVVAFFRRHGHFSFDHLMTLAKDQHAKDKAKDAADLSHATSLLGPYPGPMTLNVPPPPIPNGAIKSAPLPPPPIVSERELEAYKECANGLMGFKASFVKTILKSPGLPASNPETLADMVVNIVIKSGYTHDRLMGIYLEDKSQNANRNGLRRLFGLTLKAAFNALPPPGVKLEDIINHIIDYYGNCIGSIKVAKSTLGISTNGGKLTKEVADKCLADHIHKLDVAVNEKYGATLANFRAKIRTLAALKSSFSDSNQELNRSPGFIGKAAEYMVKLVAFAGFDLSKLKRLYEKSEASLAGNVYSALRKHQELIPTQLWTIDGLVEHVIEHFKPKESSLKEVKIETVVV
ncbi:uncharacterized protein LOC131890195 [Tigriopus californicus]|nr:uncharacterized protein LOC131890195 [Tigriopus californicus]